MKVKDKVAIVTGASSGIGLATAKLLSKNGAKVILAARSAEILKKLEKDVANSKALPTDVTVDKQLDRLVSQTLKHYGKIDILVNNAGRGYDALIEKIEDEKLIQLFKLNFLATLHLMQKVIPVMREQKGGSIINVSSGTSLMAIPTVGAYSSFKRALNGLSFTAREELADDGIIVSVVYPFITDTNFYKNIIGKPRKSAGVITNRNTPPPDSAEYVATKILEAIESGKKEIFAHDWMNNPM